MVKGISKQVILVRPQEEALFEQAIFIVKDGAANVTEQELLRQAREASQDTGPGTRSNAWLPLLSFAGGSGLVGLAWMISALI